MGFLESEKITLRALEPEDLDVLYKWENDSRLWQNGSTLTPYSKFALRDYLENSLQDIFQSRQLRLMVEEKQSKKPVGTIDLYDYDPIDQRAGIGILLDEDFRNLGYGTETLHLIADYAFRFLLLNQLYAYVPLSNQASVKLFDKCGYEHSGILKSWVKTPEGFEDVYFMQLLK
ncbi:GNAT family N-acetyltransferase [Bacteroidales bacterium OttesenSCG-928-A17]|nr:GNAT family N-acetyltransferase [Bacteroidales bacterium OttesenSCG-928-A17]